MLTNLKKLREQAEITQKQLAEAIGVSQQSINKYENHDVEPDVQTLIRIADYFHTSVDFLIGHSDGDSPQKNALSFEEHRLLEQYRDLSEKQKKCISTLINSYLD